MYMRCSSIGNYMIYACHYYMTVIYIYIYDYTIALRFVASTLK